MMPFVFTTRHPEFEEISEVVPASTLELHADDGVSKHTPILDELPTLPVTRSLVSKLLPIPAGTQITT